MGGGYENVNIHHKQSNFPNLKFICTAFGSFSTTKSQGKTNMQKYQLPLLP